MRARPFILLDLTSQAGYIPHEVRGWPRQQMFSWLRQYGEVLEFTLQAGDNVERWGKFIAPTGLSTAFLLTDECYLRLYLGEYVMKTFWKPREVTPDRNGSATR